MTITLNADYDVTLNNALLGYVGETNARPVSVEGMEVDGADRYVLTIDYGDGVEYEVDITGGQWTPTADILRSAQTVSCQIAAKKLSGQEYILVKKSRIFRLRIGAAIGDNAVPSPDVAMDALDRIDAIGRQAHADMQTAATAADTATTAAENAKKSATAAEKSADTAMQAASRAETAQTAAETSATQADTAMQGAETARAEAVKSQNSAKVSAAQAATSAQQTTADKNITAGYAKTAKTNADSTAADRQAVQTLATQVTADKATVADSAAKVAADRTAAETAAQTAQAVADSLPDDYTTAVGKIAENTAEIANVKLTDKELQRRVNALYDMGQGITHKFETNTETAYQKTVPTGGKLMSVKSVGGKSIVWNQMVDSNIDISETTRYSFNGQHLTTNTTDNLSVSDNLCALPTIPAGHKVLLKIKFIAGNVGNKTVSVGGYHETTNTSWQGKIDLPKNTDLAGKSLFAMDTTTDTSESIRFFLYDATIPLLTNIDCYINYYDLTAMFGAGNEPTSVEEFEKMFPADYYPYNEGEIVSAGVTEVVEQGKNLFDYTDKTHYGANISKVENGVIYTKGLTTTVLNVPTIAGNKYTLSFKVKSNTANQGGLRWSIQKGKNTSYAHDSSLIKSEVGFAANTEYQAVATFVADTDFVSLCTIVGMVYDVQLELGDTATDYSPFYQTAYPIPAPIKSLPGYGWSAGTARNYIDYENKRYVQCVGSVDLGTLAWNIDQGIRWYTYVLPKYLTDKNAICNKLIYSSNRELNDESKWINSGAGFFEICVANVTTSADVAAKMSGVILYYELATPIVTDISDLIPDDFLRNLTVEAGGSVTFKNGNGDYRIPVPSEEEYVVKLSEVGGTT